ncbi:gamma-secretase subunit Aph-1 [Pilobolus umbonatus]|nr:gamma-secretase subunit Aph-1 [Pilobolus umbonatus]
MSFSTFFGCFFIAYGPILATFILILAPNAQYVLLMVASAFFCLIALLLSSVIWYFAEGIQNKHYITIAYSIFIQEVCRLCFYLLLNKAERGLNAVARNPKSPFNRSAFAFVSGCGYALLSSLVGFISLLIESIGPGVLMCPSCPKATIYFISAITTSLFSLMHMTWMVIASEGFHKINSWEGVLKVSWVILSHYGASFATTLNTSTTVSYGCVYPIVICVFIIAVSTAMIFMSLKSRYQ